MTSRQTNPPAPALEMLDNLISHCQDGYVSVSRYSLSKIRTALAASLPGPPAPAVAQDGVTDEMVRIVERYVDHSEDRPWVRVMLAEIIAPLVVENARLRAENAELTLADEAIGEKLKSLAPHGTCGCSYDRPGDVCMHHSPALARAEADANKLRYELERWKDVREKTPDWEKLWEEQSNRAALAEADANRLAEALREAVAALLEAECVIDADAEVTSFNRVQDTRKRIQDALAERDKKDKSNG